MENKLQIVEHCWEILRAIEKHKEQEDALEDLLGEIEANVSDILYYLLKSCDYKDIGCMMKIGGEISAKQ